MDGQPHLPDWVRPGVIELRDVFFLALDMVDRNSQEAAGIVAVITWLLGQSGGPVTGRTDGADRRDVAVVELCAAEHLADDGPVPPLHEVCQHYEVAYLPALPVDVGHARGAWLALRWTLGETSRPPLDVPIRCADGSLMGEVDIYAKLVSGGKDRTAARKTAVALAKASRRLAELVEQTAARRGSGQ